MKTIKIPKIKINRFASLARIGDQIFHASDAAALWGISNKNTLYKTLSRNVISGNIFRIQKGLYSVISLKDIDPYLLGSKALHGGSAYISCETVLFNAGIINQRPIEITLVSSISKRFDILDNRFRSRKLNDRFLSNGVGINSHNGYRIATVSRAIADLRYFNQKKYFDASNSKIIDWKEVNKISKIIGYL